MPGTHARARRIELSKLSWIAATYCSSVVESNNVDGGPPAFASRMSIGPSASSVARASRSASPSFETSPTRGRTRVLATFMISVAACSSSGLRRATIATLAPSHASSRAMANPSPDDPPVTSATLFVRLRSIANWGQSRRNQLYAGTEGFPSTLTPITRLPMCRRDMRRVLGLVGRRHARELHRAHFELRDPGVRVKGRVRQQIRRGLAIVHRHEYLVSRDTARDTHRDRDAATPRADGDRIAVANVECLGVGGAELDRRR